MLNAIRHEAPAGPAIIDAVSIPPAHLSPENLDRNSRFYVPPELWPYYDLPKMADLRHLGRDEEYGLALRIYRAELAEDPAAWRRVLDGLAEGGTSQRTVREIDERGPGRYRPSDDVIRTKAARLSEEDRFWWLHLRTLEDAAKTAPRAEAGKAAAEALVVAETCQVCGARVHRDAGDYGRRIQRVKILDRDAELATNADGRGSARVCPECEPVLRAAVVARAASATLADGRTRADAVQAFLEGWNR